MPGRPGITARIFAPLTAIVIACSGTKTTGPDDGADRIPPQAVSDAALAYPAAGGSAVLTWTAPADDDAHNAVDRYDIRYSHSAPINWELSIPAADPPSPLRRGATQTYEFNDPHRGRDLYAAIRSYDAAGNASPIGNAAHVYIVGYGITGVCTEALTGEPVTGLGIEVTAGRRYEPVQDAQGRYQLSDLAEGVVNVSLRSGASGRVFHDYDRSLVLNGEMTLDHIMIEYAEAEIPSGKNILRLCLIGAGISGSDPRLRKWRAYPISVHVPPFVNVHGVDYENWCKLAAAGWNERTGLDIFELVDIPSEADVTLAFKTPGEMGIHNGLAYIDEDDDGFPVGGRIDIVDSFSDAARLHVIALHEFGHAIRLEHLPAGYLMYGGQPIPSDVTNDEVKLVQLLVALPIGHDMSVYDPLDPR